MLMWLMQHLRDDRNQRVVEHRDAHNYNNLYERKETRKKVSGWVNEVCERERDKKKD